MSFRILTFLFLILCEASFAQGRKPAVEDFVGIEIDQPETTPQGTEVLFNFEKEIDKFEANKGQVIKATPKTYLDTPGLMTAFITSLFVLGLPAMIWFAVMNRLKQKAKMESASNIETLEKYRKQKSEEKKNQDQYKKAS